MEEVLRRNPSDVQALTTRWFIDIDLHEYDRVIAESSELIKRYPKVPSWYLMRGAAYYAKKETRKGLRDWMIAGALEQSYMRFRCDLKPGSLLFGLAIGDNKEENCPSPSNVTPDERIAACTKRIATDPNSVPGYYERASVYRVKRDYKHAAADFSEIIRLDPTDAEAFRERAGVRIDLRAYSEAIADYEKAMQLDPNNAEDHLGRARAYGVLKKWEEAIQDCNEAVRLDPHFAGPYIVRGWIYEERHDYEKAIPDYSEAIRLSPRHPDSYRQRAHVRLYIGDYGGAISDQKEILKLNPASVDARSRIAWYLSTGPDAALRNGKEAKRLATEACEMTSWKDKLALSCLAAACAACGEFEQAVKWQTKAIELAPETDKDEGGPYLDLYKAHKPYRYSPSGKKQ